MRYGKSALIILAGLVAQTALAWDSPGHETVAAIAWDTMKPATRTQVAQILNNAQKGDCLNELGAGGDPRAYFIRAATWPDVVRPGDKKDAKGNVIQKDTRPCTRFHVRDAHFNDQFWSGESAGTGPKAPIDRTELPSNAVNAIARLMCFESAVPCKTAPCGATPVERAHNLAWMLHLVGDIHQPLHNASRITTEPKEAQGDAGGNLFLLKEDANTPPNLHSFWDDIIDKTVPQQAGEQEIAYIDRLATKIKADHPRQKLTAAQLEPGQFARWSNEGFALAKQLAYPATLTRKGTPLPSYRQTAFNMADAQIALAGYRLADLLDRMFQ